MRQDNRSANDSVMTVSQPEAPVTQPPPILGICRFSYLGVGDWKDYHGGRAGRTHDEVTADRRRFMFDPARLAGRFATSRH